MATIATGLNTAIRGCFCSMGGRIYFCNNFDAVKVWDGIDSSMRDAGIAAPAAVIGSPTSAAAGNCSNGIHLFRYRYKNSKSGYISNPSIALAVTIAGGNGLITFNIGGGGPVVASADAKVDTIVLEMTPVDSGVFYVVNTALNTAGSITANLVDANLIQQFNADANWGNAENLDTYRNDIPPVGTVLVSHKGRMWSMGDEAYAITGTFTDTSTGVTGTGFSAKWVGRLVRVSGAAVAYVITAATATTLTLSQAWSGTTGSKSASVYSATPNRGYYSVPGYPESFFPSVQARDFLPNRSDQVVAAFSRRDALYIFGKYSGERLIYNEDPSAVAAPLIPTQGNRGAFHQRALVEVDGQLMAWDRLGIYVVGETPKHISADVDLALGELVDYAQASEIHGGYDPVERVAMWFFTAVGGTLPNYAVCYEVDTGRWFFNRFLQAITACSLVPTSDGQVRLLLGDENGYCWFYSIDGSYDGVPPACPSVVTPSGSPSTTVVPVSDTLTTSPSLAGVMFYNPVTGESKVIASNTASQITLASALSQAPTVGVACYLGPIPFEYRTKWWDGDGLDKKRSPVYLLIKLFPGSAAGKFRVYIYTDFSTSPTSFTVATADRFPDGVTPGAVGSATTYFEVDLDAGSGDGFVAVPLGCEWKRALQARITSIKPDGELRFLDVRFSPTRTGETAVPHE